MDVGDWLRGLGLGRYETVFRDNEIDVEVLPELTESDFEKLGVPLGHRKRLLKAIADAGATAIAPPTVTARPDAQAAERRQLTVMFIDLVGSTALSAKLDPEDLRSIFGAYQRCCAELVKRNGGFVAKYMGDGVLAYFGYPQAHEDDAERAVEAGLALVEAVPKLDTVAGVPLSARVGIATGLVVVGDLIGTGAARERAVVGQTPNLAARLQAIAEPNTVVIADGTRKLIGNLFELERISAARTSGASPIRRRPGGCCGRAPWRAASRRCTPAASPRWSDARMNPNCCGAAGRGRRAAKGRWFCSPASRASASRG